MNYQKVYMNHIHTNTILCQLAQMWRNQLLCDAQIYTGKVVTKAHRIVLLAACPILQWKDNASNGTELEVHLGVDIKQEAVNTFLQYLYEGFMLLSEDNVKHVEKVANFLQVDSVIKCCMDFYQSIGEAAIKTPNVAPGNEYLEFCHVGATGIQKSYHRRAVKRRTEPPWPNGQNCGKRQACKSLASSQNIASENMDPSHKNSDVSSGQNTSSGSLKCSNVSSKINSTSISLMVESGNNQMNILERPSKSFGIMTESLRNKMDKNRTGNNNTSTNNDLGTQFSTSSSSTTSNDGAKGTFTYILDELPPPLLVPALQNTIHPLTDTGSGEGQDLNDSIEIMETAPVVKIENVEEDVNANGYSQNQEKKTGLNEYNHDDREGSVDDVSAQYTCTLSTISDASEPSVSKISSTSLLTQQSNESSCQSLHSNLFMTSPTVSNYIPPVPDPTTSFASHPILLSNQASSFQGCKCCASLVVGKPCFCQAGKAEMGVQTGKELFSIEEMKIDVGIQTNNEDFLLLKPADQALYFKKGTVQHSLMQSKIKSAIEKNKITSTKDFMFGTCCMEVMMSFPDLDYTLDIQNRIRDRFSKAVRWKQFAERRKAKLQQPTSDSADLTLDPEESESEDLPEGLDDIKPSQYMPRYEVDSGHIITSQRESPIEKTAKGPKKRKKTNENASC